MATRRKMNERRQQVIDLLKKGPHTAEEMAKKLGVSPNQVRYVVRQKLGKRAVTYEHRNRVRLYSLTGSEKVKQMADGVGKSSLGYVSRPAPVQPGPVSYDLAHAVVLMVHHGVKSITIEYQEARNG